MTTACALRALRCLPAALVLLLAGSAVVDSQQPQAANAQTFEGNPNRFCHRCQSRILRQRTGGASHRRLAQEWRQLFQPELLALEAD